MLSNQKENLEIVIDLNKEAKKCINLKAVILHMRNL